MKCAHEEFQSRAIVTRITSEEEPARIGYMASVRIMCTACGTAFQFVGAPHGWSPRFPTTSIDALEIRLPITPQLVKRMDS
jgi:hypothetical protein